MTRLKFNELTLGQRFYWQGEEYIKAGPLVARTADGKRQRMIPRSALLEADAPEAPTQVRPTELAAAEVEQAFEAFYRLCEQELPTTGDATEVAERLSEGRRLFRTALGLSG